MKIIITEQQLIKLSEEIDPSEAYSDINSTLSVIQNRRNIGFISSDRDLLNMIKKNGIKYFRCPSNPNNMVIFRPEYEEQALELLNIAEKYGGYLSYKATESETRRIGELLGYHKHAIDDFIEKKYKRKHRIN